MDNLTLKLESHEGNEIIWREGEAAPIREPLNLMASGDIRTVGTFIAGRDVPNLQGIDRESTLVTVDKDAGTIKLETDPNDQFGTVISGTLLINDDLKQFDINGSKMFSQKELIKLLKFSRIHFVDPLVQNDLLNAYKAFTFQTKTEGHAKGDDRGNKSVAYDKAVETNLPKEFSLKIPIYKGERSVTFRVDLCMDVTDGGAKFWCESIELHELLQTEKELIFQRELLRCEGLVIIYK